MFQSATPEFISSSEINSNLKFRSRTSVLCRSLFCLSFEKTAEEGIIREVKSLGYFRDCL